MAKYRSISFKLLVPLFFSLCASSPAESPFVLFTDPMGDYFTRGKLIENTIADYIDRANVSIKIAMYNFDSSRLLEAFIRARSRNVDVKIVGDDEELETPGYQELIKNGFNLKTGNQNGIQHNKFIIIDSEVVITGTGNFTHSSFYRNDDNFVFLKNSNIADRFEFEFNQLHSGFFSKLKSTNLLPGNSEEGNIKIYFTPQESNLALKEIISAIDSARDSIYYMIFAFTQDEIAAALLSAAKRGVKIHGIHDVAFSTGASAEAPGLYYSSLNSDGTASEDGPFIHYDGNENSAWINGAFHGSKMHCKTMIIDPDSNSPVVLTGSFNWSENALENNDENLLIMKNKSAAKALMNQWNRAWEFSHNLSELVGEISGSISKRNDIIFSEILSAGTVNNQEFSSKDDYIEIFNNSSKSIDLYNWILAWQVNGHQYSWRLPSDSSMGNLKIEPGEYKVFYCFNNYNFHNFQIDKSILIKIPENKNFNLNHSEFKISLYDRKMNLIDETSANRNDLIVSLDPVEIRTASINRRQKSPGVYDDNWFASKRQCHWPICQNANLFGSPGYKNEPELPVSFKSIKFLDQNNFSVIFNGIPGYCNDIGNFVLKKDNIIIPLTGIQTSPLPNELIFNASGLTDPLSVYSLESNSSSILNSNSVLVSNNRIFLGTETGLSISDDNGITFQKITLADFPVSVNQIFKDINTGVLYLASNNGIYISSDNGLTFINYLPGTDFNGYIVYEVKTNLTYLVASTAAGLYYADKNLLNFTLINQNQYYTLYFSDSILLAGSNGFIDIWNIFPGPLSLRRNIAGSFISVNYVNNLFYAASSSGVYTSSDNGLTFQLLAYPEISGYSIQMVKSSLSGNPLLVSYETAFEMNPNPVKIEIKENLLPVILSDIISYNGNFIGVGSSGIYSGAFLDQLSHTYPVTCPNLPSGSLFFSGYDSGSKNSSALLKLNELSIAATNGRDWIELIAESGGNTQGIRLTYYGTEGKSILFEFPSWYANTNDVIVIFFNNSPRNIPKGSEFSIHRSNPYEIYLSALNPDRGDAIISLEYNNQIQDSLYYSNRDGNINLEFIDMVLKENYYNKSLQESLPNPYLFPVNEVNDFLVQESATEIPAYGNNRTVSRVGNKWIITKNPSPGVK